MELAQLGRLGVVVIGRNEGARLVACLESVLREDALVVYVDSGSSDESVAECSRRGVDVVELDAARPLSAARARNEGFRRLQERAVPPEFVQFVDGDCELVEGWLAEGRKALESDPGLGAVCGWRRERHPERSIYNRVCDIEWRSGAVGETDAFGGDVMIRSTALREVGGYEPALIAGEDPDLCLRLRRAGWPSRRLDRPMTRHDAAMTRLAQWWRRTLRGGYAFEQLASRHRDLPERPYRAEIRRIFAWGLAVPLGIALGGAVFGPATLAFLVVYPLQALRIALRTGARGFDLAGSWAWGWSCALSKFPQLAGVLRSRRERAGRRSARLIEYKRGAPSGTRTRP